MKTRFIHILFAERKKSKVKQEEAKRINSKRGNTEKAVRKERFSKTLSGYCLGKRSSVLDRSLVSLISSNRKGENSSEQLKDNV